MKCSHSQTVSVDNNKRHSITTNFRAHALYQVEITRISCNFHVIKGMCPKICGNWESFVILWYRLPYWRTGTKNLHVSVELWKRGPKGHISCTWVQCATKSKKSQQIRSQGSHLVFPIGPKNTNLVEDVEILLPVKFSLNFFQRFQRRSRKCLSQSEARAAILFFRSVRKRQTW